MVGAAINRTHDDTLSFCMLEVPQVSPNKSLASRLAISFILLCVFRAMRHVCNKNPIVFYHLNSLTQPGGCYIT